MKLNAAIRGFLNNAPIALTSGQINSPSPLVDLWYALAEGEHFLADMAKPVREAPARSLVSLTDLVEAVAAQEGVTIMIAAGGPPR